MEERNFFHSTQSNTMEQEIADALTEQAAAAEGERQLLEGISPPEIGLETKESGTGRVKDRREEERKGVTIIKSDTDSSGQRADPD